MQPLMNAAQAGLFSQANQCAFRGIADDAVIRGDLFEPGVVTGKGAVEQPPQRRPMGNRFQ